MRLATVYCFLFALLGIGAAQDTNFPLGPQYLRTGSPLLLRPIATPTLSLDTPLPPIPSLPEVGPVVHDQPFIPNPILLQGPDLLPIYYGYPMPSVVVFISDESPGELPASIVDSGVVGMTDVQSLREQGHGVPLGEASIFWKAHKSHASRVYTNVDLERLHGS
jgi:hypothetical protein